MPKLTWIGHSAFMLEDDAGNVVAVDPFIEDNPVTSVDPKSLKLSTILLTHAHNDHVGDTIDMAEWNDAKVICTVELGHRACGM
jgi:L-ascorbate metabolism protein UlaG (beta-lactamase superfamily)